MSPRSRWIIRLFALGGLFFAGWASLVHYKLLTDPTYISPCDINTRFNCSHLYLSRYGSVFGIPVALGGLFWFALVSVLAWFGPVAQPVAAAAATAGADSSKSRPSRGVGGTFSAEVVDSYLFALATIGLAAILYLGFASYQMHTVCLLCVGTYVCVVGIFVTAGLSASGRVGRLPLRLLEDLRHMTGRPVPLIVAIVFITGAASVIMFFPKEGALAQAAQAAVPKDVETQFRDAWAKQPRKDLGIPTDGAKVLVVKFNDWLCPSCKAWHMAYKPVLDRYQKESPGAVKYVVKDWVWNSRCNVAVAQTFPGHEGSCEAAAAVRMARDRGKADEMIEWLFANQERLGQLGWANTSANNGSSNAIKAQAEKMLGISDFDREYVAKLVEIRRDESDGVALSIQGTPTYFVNGVRAEAGSPPGALPVPYFDLGIKIELAKPSGK